MTRWLYLRLMPVKSISHRLLVTEPRRLYRTIFNSGATFEAKSGRALTLHTFERA